MNDERQFIMTPPAGAPTRGFFAEIDDAVEPVIGQKVMRQGRWSGQTAGVNVLTAWREQLKFGRDIDAWSGAEDHYFAEIVAPHWQWKRNGHQHQSWKTRLREVDELKAGKPTCLVLITDRTGLAFQPRDQRSGRKPEVCTDTPRQYFLAQGVHEYNEHLYARLGLEFDSHETMSEFVALVNDYGDELGLESWNRHNYSEAEKHALEQLQENGLTELTPMVPGSPADTEADVHFDDSNQATGFPLWVFDVEDDEANGETDFRKAPITTDESKSFERRGVDPNRPAQVYIFTESGNNPRQFKVGASDNLTRRQKELTQAIPLELEAALTDPIAFYLAERLEKRIHSELKRDWPDANPIGNEWYLLERNALNRAVAMVNKANTEALTRLARGEQ